MREGDTPLMATLSGAISSALFNADSDEGSSRRRAAVDEGGHPLLTAPFLYVTIPRTTRRDNGRVIYYEIHLSSLVEAAALGGEAAATARSTGAADSRTAQRPLGSTLRISRRYNDFRTLHKQLSSRFGPLQLGVHHPTLGALPALPTAWFVSDQKETEVEQRRFHLEVYLQQLLVPANGFLRQCVELRAFLTDDALHTSGDGVDRSGGPSPLAALVPGLNHVCPASDFPVTTEPTVPPNVVFRMTTEDTVNTDNGRSLAGGEANANASQRDTWLPGGTLATAFAFVATLRSKSSSRSGKIVKVVRKDTGIAYALKAVRKNRKEAALSTVTLRSEWLRCTRSPASAWVARLHAAFQSEDYVLFLMDYLPGGSLQVHVNRWHQAAQAGHAQFAAARDHTAKGPFSLSDTLHHSSELIAAVTQLHDAGFAHDMLGRGTVLFDAAGHVRLLPKNPSSGAVSLGGGTTTGWNTEYVAPEAWSGTTRPSQASGTAGPSRSGAYARDWWAVGCLIFEMFTGETPFVAADTAGTMAKCVNAELAIRFPEHVPRDACDVIEGLLRRDPVSRLEYARGEDGMSQSRWLGIIDQSQVACQRLRAPWQVSPADSRACRWIDTQHLREWPLLPPHEPLSSRAKDELQAAIGQLFPVVRAGTPSALQSSGSTGPPARAVTIAALARHWRLGRVVRVNRLGMPSWPWGSDVAGQLCVTPGGHYHMQLTCCPSARVLELGRAPPPDAVHSLPAVRRRAQSCATYVASFGRLDVLVAPSTSSSALSTSAAAVLCFTPAAALSPDLSRQLRTAQLIAAAPGGPERLMVQTLPTVADGSAEAHRDIVVSFEWISESSEY